MELQHHPIIARRGKNNTDFSVAMNLILEIATQIKYNDDGQFNQCVFYSILLFFFYILFLN